jgi:hypothetical protein
MPINKYRSHKKLWLALTGAILVVAVALFVLEITNTTHFFHTSHIPEGKTISEYNKGEPATDGDTNNGDPGPTTSTSNSKDSDSIPETASLIAPTGNFVSSHFPSISSNETSTCNTTPGAKCTITFSKGSVTKSLPTQTIDAGGATYWSWTPASAGLTTGTWKVQAVATLGAQILTADDALSLQVK